LIHQEKHHRVKELAETWSFSANGIRRPFRDEPGVLRIGNG